jgi:glycyl-tRNA synthetase
MQQPLDFQSIIMTLQHFWADRGCLIWQPYYAQIGAGTMNPATFLRVLGPEPWNVAYVEPSIRPDDARYGENPNRMQMHYQFQVILKPSPANPQDIYLHSLEALGIDPRRHDIRFVEDNWEQPALGAWGLGWEVWLDGQEITQFTYFQQAGGQLCDPVSVEFTYGLDRIAISLQRVRGFQEIRWNSPPGVEFTAGDVNLQAEQEQSTYYFEIADVSRLRQMFDLFEGEAEACLAHNLTLPAYDNVLKCSHTFNVLDTRGAIGVTERQAFFGRMRDLSRRVAEIYLAQRQVMEYPWLRDQGVGDRGIGEKPRSTPIPVPLSPSPLLFEIGTEELPASDLDTALEQLHARVPLLLEDLRLSHGAIHIWGTTRRLVVYVEDLAAHSADREQSVKGPPAHRAFDAMGVPTQAAEGFARSKGVSVGDLQVRELDGGRYVVAVVHEPGRPVHEILAEALPGLIASLRFDRPMRWNSSNVAFSRPIRWLLALVGDRAVRFEYAGLCSGNTTFGLRFTEPKEYQPETPAEYFSFLEEQGIILDEAERQAQIRSQIDRLAAGVGGQIPDDPGLMSEVVNLVEMPAALIGSFDHSYLELPGEVLISVMKKHQRYFPVVRQGQLLPNFIAVRNGDDLGMELVTEGNEHVIRARFSDADFFVKDDLKHSLEDFLPRLGTLTFQVKLGSMLDKTRRVVSLVDAFSSRLGLGAQEEAIAHRAGELCKADLVTKMVVEMTSLQGIMGRYYALQSGESEAVGTAIFEHYLPRYAGDALPKTIAGLAVGLADRLDTLSGLFVIGMAPTGARDPFAQRRSALGIVQALIAHQLDFDLRPALEIAASTLPAAVNPESTEAKGQLDACLVFIIERLRNLLLEQGNPYDVVEAILSAQGFNPARSARAVVELSRWTARPDWKMILPAYSRCVRITRDQEARYPVDPGAFIEPAEKDLSAALVLAESTPRAPGSVDDFLNAFLPMIPRINRFFDEVLVMTEETALRENRLGLLQRITALAEGIADMSKLEGF